MPERQRQASDAIGYRDCVTGGAVRLGVDFGTSSTVAVIAVDDRPPRPLLFDGSPLMPSAVCADSAGRMLVGRDAVQLAAASPAGFEPHPKRCVDEGTVLLAGQDVAVEAMFAAVFRRVSEQAARFGDRPITEVTVTHPAGWGAARKAVLRKAAPEGARLVAEPVAAAHFFVDVAGQRLPDGATALIYDLGAGTFDASIVRRVAVGDRPASFEVVASTGLTDAGGLDIDAAIVDSLRSTLADEQTWQRLADGDDPAARRGRRQLWDNVREAKEVLSRLSTTLVHVPLFEVDVPLGREQLDQLAAPVLDRTVRASRDLIASVDERPVAVFLAGGASHMPAVATALHRALAIAPSIVDEPELAVAEGALRVPSANEPGRRRVLAGSGPRAGRPGVAEPVPGPGGRVVTGAAADRRHRRLGGAARWRGRHAVGHRPDHPALPDAQPNAHLPARRGSVPAGDMAAGVGLRHWSHRQRAAAICRRQGRPVDVPHQRHVLLGPAQVGTIVRFIPGRPMVVAGTRHDHRPLSRQRRDAALERRTGQGQGDALPQQPGQQQRGADPNLRAHNYTCSGDQLSITSTVTESSSEWIRVLPRRPSPSPSA